MALIEVMNPTMRPPRAAKGLAPRPETLNGKTAAFRVKWSRFEVFMDRFEELFRERFQPREIVKTNEELTRFVAKKGSGKSEEFFSKADWAIMGLAA